MPDFDEPDQGGAEPPPFNLEPGKRAEAAFSRHTLSDYLDPAKTFTEGGSQEMRAAAEKFHADYAAAVSELATADLVEALYHSDESVRLRAVTALRDRKDPTTLPHLVAMLYEETGAPSTVRAVMFAIGKFGQAADEAVPALLGKLPRVDRANTTYTRSIINTLGAIGTESSRDALEYLVRDERSPMLRLLIARELSSMSPPEEEHSEPTREPATTENYTVIPVREDTPLWRDALEFVRAWYSHVHRKGRKQGLDEG